MNRNPLSVKAFWGRVNACRTVRKGRFRMWKDNVSMRRGKPFRQGSSEDTVSVPADWSRTKNKESQLFYQVPEFVAQPRQPQWAPIAPVIASAVNFELSEKIHLEYVMHECLGDVINAAGIMAAMVSFEASFANVAMNVAPAGGMGAGPMAAAPQTPPMPDQNPEGQGGLQPQGDDIGEPDQQQDDEDTEAPNEEMIPETVFQQYDVNRISPGHLLWPLEFVGSNWRKATWLGREGYLSVAEAVRRGWVKPGTEGVQITDEDWFLVDEFSDTKPADSYIKFVEIFYYPYYFDPKVKDPRMIKRIVLIEHKDGQEDKPAVHENFTWQKPTPDGRNWIGMTTLPIKVGTITHISDMAIPPSDSEIGRPQVRELIKSRNQQIRQRDHSMPIRWFDVNQVDPQVAIKLRAGKWQDIIPMNGPGDHAIGEVARAQYPPENWNFDKVIKSDLDESWSMGAMQQGITTPGETTATEVKEISGANDVRLAMEQQWVMRFVLEIAEGVAQLMQMFADQPEWTMIVGDDGVRALQQWNKDSIPGEYLWKFKPDSQLKLDVGQRRQEGLNLYKLLRKDPLINPQLLVRRVLEDHGLDWTKMIVPQQPPKKDNAKISASFKGEDLLSPMAIALINKGDDPITVQDLTAAQQLVNQSKGMVAPPQPPMAGAPPQQGNPGHPGPADVVQPLNRRYEQGGDHGVEGSRDSGMPAIPKQ